MINPYYSGLLGPQNVFDTKEETPFRQMPYGLLSQSRLGGAGGAFGGAGGRGLLGGEPQQRSNPVASLMNSPFGTSLLNNLLGQKGAPSMPSFFANGYPTDFNQQIGVNNMLSDVGAYNSLPADAWGSLFSGGGSMLGEAGMTAADDWMLAGLSAI